MGNVVDAYIEAIAGLRGEIYTLRAELEESRASEDGAHMIIATERAEVAQLRRRVAELEGQVALAGAVKVKPLVWAETHDDRGDGSSDHNGGYEANSEFGGYEIGMGFGSDSYYWSAQDEAGNEIGSFDDPDAAKAAAQADYEARIRAALQPDPDARQADLAKVWQPIETAPKDGTPVLLWPGVEIWTGCTVPAVGAWASNCFGWICFSSGAAGEVATHWMPLPTPPAGMAAKIGGE